MALAVSGAMSLGGATADRSVNCELGLSGTAAITLNDAAVRDLAGVASGAISMDDFYGKSSYTLPTTLGEANGGGYYIGTFSACSHCYYLIVAPNATGCAFCQWKTTNTCSSVGNDRCDGYGNTYDHLNNVSHPAGNWTATRTLDGYSDWYLPAMNEANRAWTNRANLPAGEGFVGAFYWVSSEYYSEQAYLVTFSGGNGSFAPKTEAFRTRAMRRVEGAS